jgi:hypothetical protein
MTTTRLTSTTVTFLQPFSLEGFEQLQPAGSYIVATEEELMDTLLAPSWKRSSSVIRLTREGAEEHVAIDPKQLQEALIRDAAKQKLATPLSSSPAEPRRSRAYSFLGRLPHRNRH